MLGLTRLRDAKRWTLWSDDRRRLRLRLARCGDLRALTSKVVTLRPRRRVAAARRR